MAFDSMAAPLGLEPGPRQRGVPPHWRRWLVALLFVLVAVLVLVAFTQWSSRRVGPAVVSVIERAQETVVARPTPPSGGGKGASAPAASAGNPGIQREISPGGGMIIKVPDAVGPAAEPIFDPRVGERTAQGVLPVVSAGGHKAYKLYSRPFTQHGKPMIAIVVTGMGISPRGTEEAIRKLPSDITLAFAPYGRDLEGQVTRARGEGHEILLQVPMEPQDYPQSDPGPHTLRGGAEARDNLNRLHWLMSRFPGYVGLTNFMGGRLMRDNAAYAPLLEEINRRGLMFLDDGTTGGSLSPQLAKASGLPLAVADRVLETGGRRTLNQILAEAESLARERGRAVISVPGLPANVERLQAYEKELSGRGLVLAPISAIIGRNAP